MILREDLKVSNHRGLVAKIFKVNSDNADLNALERYRRGPITSKGSHMQFKIWSFWFVFFFFFVPCQGWNALSLAKKKRIY